MNNLFETIFLKFVSRQLYQAKAMTIMGNAVPKISNMMFQKSKVALIALFLKWGGIGVT
jgi:hypothetical protein